MHWVINSYNGNTDWIKEYTDSVTFYDKKDLNVGYNIYDYMDYIVSNYDKLPDVILFGKDNMLERHITKEEFDKVVNNKTFTPLLTQNHKTYLPVCYYENGMYYEKNDSWYMREYPSKYFTNYGTFAFTFDLPNTPYLPFAPGACYIVPKENILKYPKVFYERLRDLVSWNKTPAEAHLIERSLYNIWNLQNHNKKT